MLFQKAFTVLARRKLMSERFAVSLPAYVSHVTSAETFFPSAAKPEAICLSTQSFFT